MRMTVALAVACVALIGLCAADESDAAVKRYELDIPRQTLDTALKELAQQTGLQIARFSDNGHGRVIVGPVSGEISAETALVSLLASSGLTYELVNDRTIAVMEAGSGGSGATAGSAGSTELSTGHTATGSRSSELPEVQPKGVGPEKMIEEDPSLNEKEKEEKDKRIEEIVVTGSRIRGAAPVGSPVITIDQTDIANSGYSTIGALIRSIPQSFGGGMNPGVVGATGSTNTGNATSASTVNLRGLGSDSTLTLVNGRRLAYDGYKNAVDISVIPLAAVERVEILTDSASSIYGSDAVAGVANFILKNDYEGIHTTARVGGTSDGGATERQVSQLFGVASATGSAMFSYEHRDQDALLASDREFSAAAFHPKTLLPERSNDSFFASGRQDLSDTLSIYIDGLYAERKAHVVHNFGTPSFSDSAIKFFSINSGVSVDLSNGWSTSLDGTLSRGEDEQQSYSISGGLPGPRRFSGYENRTASIEGQAAGPLFELPSGTVEVAIGAGYRSEKYDDDGGTLGRRHLDYEFAELKVPLVRPNSERVGLERLEFSISARRENYSDFGTSTTPKVGLQYTPTSDLTVRSSWGESFRAPDMVSTHGFRELYILQAPAFGVSSPPDAQFLSRLGSNRSLEPETARSWTAGFDYEPSWLRPLYFGVTYYDIDYRDRLAFPIDTPAAALSDSIYAPFVMLNPTPEAQAALISELDRFQSFLPPDVAYDPLKVVALVQNHKQNVAAQQIRGVDLIGDYQFQGEFGELDLSFNVAWLRLSRAFLPGSPESTLSGTVFNPPKFRSRLGLAWHLDSWSVASFVNYVGDGTDNTNGVPIEVGSWTTVDAQVAYDASAWGGIFQGLRIRAASQNLFGRNPPALPADHTRPVGIGYDSTNASPLGRFLSLTLQKDW